MIVKEALDILHNILGKFKKIIKFLKLKSYIN